MEKYVITIEEHISGAFAICADSMEEAMRIAEENYKTGKFIIPPTPPTSRLMMGRNENGNEETEWTEF